MEKKSIAFDVAKKESHTPNNGFKKLVRRLRPNYKISSIKDQLSRDVLNEANLVIFGGPRESFVQQEFDELKAWIADGGSALILLNTQGGGTGGGGGGNVVGEVGIGGGGSSSSSSNDQLDPNFISFLEGYGITTNKDTVMRTVFHKYLHPKEVFIADGVTLTDLSRSKRGGQGGGLNATKSLRASSAAVASSGKENNAAGGEQVTFVYPYGSTISVKRPARSLLSSGSVSFPANRPIAAICDSELLPDGGIKRTGRLAVIGSADMFGDDWIDKEENTRLCEVLVSWLLGSEEVELSAGGVGAGGLGGRHDTSSTEQSEHTPVPFIEALSQSIKPSLQGMDELPRDFTKMFDLGLFRFDTDLIPQTLKMYDLLGVPHDPLTLIPPQFECPLPKLQPATFAPAMREALAPALDQFDLDEHFAKEGLRLAQLTNKCTNADDDLEYYISESGEILGVMQSLPFGERSAKHILFHIFKQIVQCKKRDGGMGTGGDGVGVGVEIGEYENEGGAYDSYPVGSGAGGGGSMGSSMSMPMAHVDLAPLQPRDGLAQVSNFC